MTSRFRHLVRVCGGVRLFHVHASLNLHLHFESLAFAFFFLFLCVCYYCIPSFLRMWARSRWSDATRGKIGFAARRSRRLGEQKKKKNPRSRSSRMVMGAARYVFCMARSDLAANGPSVSSRFAGRGYFASAYGGDAIPIAGNSHRHRFLFFLVVINVIIVILRDSD